MSFLAGGRLAAKEGAYFLQESKHAVSRLSQKKNKNNNNHLSSSSSSTNLADEEGSSSADVLPEVLRHSLPSKIFEPPSDSSLSIASKWVLPHSSKKGSSSFISPDALNPLRAYLSFPQVTFGPKRWQLPESEHSVSASTANELRLDQYPPVNPKKLEAAAEALSQIGKAFVIATTIVFGGAALAFGFTASKLDVQSSDDLRTKGQDLVQAKFEMFREQLLPLRTWAENTSQKWHIEREEKIKENLLIKELSKRLGVKTSN